MQLVRHSLADAWHALKSNWIVLWFPILVGFTFSLLAVLFAGLVINFGFSWAMAGQMENALLMAALFIVIMLLVAAAIGAGQTEMFRGAASGEAVQAAHFVAGVKRFTWRFLGSYLLLGLLAVVIAVLFMGSSIYQLAYLGTQLFTSLNNSPAALLYRVYQLAPAALWGSLLLTLLNFVLGAWNMFVVDEDIGLFAAYSSSVRLIVGNLGPFLALALLAFLVSLLVLGLANGGSRQFGFVLSILNIVCASYFQLAKPVLPPPAERQDPPELLV